MSKSNKKQKRTIRRGLFLAIFAGIIVLSLALTPGQGKGLKVGDVAPNFELVDLDGKVHRLSDYKGQGVFLNFWGTWCAPCKREMPHMESQYQAFENQGVHMLAVNLKNSELEVEAFKNSYGLSFPIALDKTEAVKEAYKVKPLPTTVLIDKEGKVAQIITTEMSEEQIKQYLEMIKP